MTDEEEWRPVAGWEEFYEVSSHGRVRSLDREQRRRNRHGPYRMMIKGRILGKPLAKGFHPYPEVSLRAKPRKANRTVHRLVCEAFHGPKPRGLEVRHLDGDPRNSRADNLEWATHAKNMRDRVKHGTNNPGEKSYLSKLTENDVREIRSSAISKKKLGLRFGVTTATIYNIIGRRTWQHVE